MTKIHVYLNFEGATESAFNFYQSVFGGEFFMVTRYGDNQGPPGLSDADKAKILHIGLPLTKDTQLHGSDVIPNLGMGEPLKMGNNVAILIAPDSREAADRFYSQLSAGGKNFSPMKDEFWGDYFGSFTDKFGVEWLINYSANPQP